MSTASSQAATDSLQDSSTRFSFTMEFMVEEIERDYYQERYVLKRIEATFRLVVPEDRIQKSFLEFQIQPDQAAFLGNADDEFCPCSRQLPIDGLIDILKWLDEVNIWDWQPPAELRKSNSGRRNRLSYGNPRDSRELHPMWAPFVNLDHRVLFIDFDDGEATYQSLWSIEVCRGGRSFEASFPVYGAPAPSTFAFDDPYCASIGTEEVPILVNHLVFLTNDELIVGLTKRLFRLLPSRKPLLQVAKFNDGKGAVFEIDFECMVARKIVTITNHNRTWSTDLRYEVPISEYDRMRFWAGLLGFKSISPRSLYNGLITTHLWPGVVHALPTPLQVGRDWSAELCDGIRSWKFDLGLISSNDDFLYLRFLEVFGIFFAQEESKSLLPTIAPPVSRLRKTT